MNTWVQLVEISAGVVGCVLVGNLISGRPSFYNPHQKSVQNPVSKKKKIKKRKK